MGSDICSCLNDLTGGESQDLSQRGTEKENTKRESKKPKVVLHKQASIDSADPLQSQKENNSISTNINSDYKNTIPNHQQKLRYLEQKKLKKNLQKNNNTDNNKNNIIENNIENNIDIEENNINNINDNKNENEISNNNIIDTNINNNTEITEENFKNNINIDMEKEKKIEKIIEKKIDKKTDKIIEPKINKNIEKEKGKKEEKEEKKEEEKEGEKEEEIIDFDNILNREEMVSENFNKFFNSQKGQEMILNMEEEDPKNKICITLHKYFVSLITRRKYKNNLKYFQKEGEALFQNCLKIIYTSNPNLKKLENTNLIKYTPDGYLQYYSDPKDLEKMKFDPKKESFDNCKIIHYEDDDSSSIDNILWIYKGQVNKQGNPHGFGEKYYKNGAKEKGYYKDGELFGWCMKIETNKNIFIGPFYGNKAITGLGEKLTWKKKVFYKGEFVDGEKSGKGEEDSNEGKFIGNFYHDKKNGKGKMIYKISGDIYEGDYKNDLFDGEGHYIWKMTGQEYTGEYKNGLMHGKGLYEWSEGEFYRGSFVNGKKEGEGELHMGNGRSYIGPFVNGRPHGIGIFDNGINFKGEMEFVDGKMNINFLKRKYTSSSISTINVNVTENNDILDNKEEKESNG